MKHAMLFILFVTGASVSSAEQKLKLTPTPAKPGEHQGFQSLDASIRNLSDSGLVCEIGRELYAATQADEESCRQRGGRLKSNPNPNPNSARARTRVSVKTAPAAKPEDPSNRFRNVNQDGTPLMPRNYDPSEASGQ